MSGKSSRIYALINSKKPKSKESQSFSFGGFAAVVDEYIEGETVTPNLLKRLNSNDTLVIENVSFLGANVHEIVTTLNAVSECGINLCLAQENISFKADKLPEIASSLLLAFRIHQSLISLRSKTALQEKKAQGIKLGRRFGFNPALKLDDYKDEIRQMRLSGVSIKKISEKYHVCPATIYNLMHKYPELFVVGGM
ncbi:MAG: recombinase family protein [Alphaproteobacteria bacterium]|nr:recombinase family protein [Alphaproteobacteria bacterium]